MKLRQFFVSVALALLIFVSPAFAANGLYAKAKQSFLEGQISWTSNTIKVVLVDLADYTVNLSTHQFLSDIPVAARVATSPALSGKSATNGVADGADITFSAVSGDTSEALVIYMDTGSASTSRLIAYIDTATNLPVTPNGGDINVTWPGGGIFNF